VVVWVFSGGGEAEVRGLTQFLQKNFPGCQFIRKTPVRQKPGPKSNKAASYGRTGQSYPLYLMAIEIAATQTKSAYAD